MRPPTVTTSWELRPTDTLIVSTQRREREPRFWENCGVQGRGGTAGGESAGQRPCQNAGSAAPGVRHAAPWAAPNGVPSPPPQTYPWHQGQAASQRVHARHAHDLQQRRGAERGQLGAGRWEGRAGRAGAGGATATLGTRLRSGAAAPAGPPPAAGGAGQPERHRLTSRRDPVPKE